MPGAATRWCRASRRSMGRASRAGGHVLTRLCCARRCCRLPCGAASRCARPRPGPKRCGCCRPWGSMRATCTRTSGGVAGAKRVILTVPAKGEIDESHIYAELGEIVDGRKPGRTNSAQITYFKSVGVAVQDAVAGRIALQNARTGNLGFMVSL